MADEPGAAGTCHALALCAGGGCVGALRGVAAITAISLVAEIGDLTRFEHPAN